MAPWKLDDGEETAAAVAMAEGKGEMTEKRLIYSMCVV